MLKGRVVHFGDVCCSVTVPVLAGFGKRYAACRTGHVLHMPGVHTSKRRQHAVTPPVHCASCLLRHATRHDTCPQEGSDVWLQAWRSPLSMQTTALEQ